MGHDEIQTPCLDELARRCRVFERGYIAAPLCRPSLASIVTGLNPFQHGITGNDVGGRPSNLRPMMRNRRSRWARPLRLLAVPVARRCLAGMWHEGGNFGVLCY